MVKMAIPRFREEQRFGQWWLWILVGSLVAMQWWGFYQQIVLGKPWGDRPAPDWMMVLIWLCFGIGLPVSTAHITPNHFSMIFRRHTGRTFTEFLAEKRLGLAEELLRDLTLNIGQVARRAGYGDAGYFARRFKQRTGLTPRQWREAL